MCSQEYLQINLAPKRMSKDEYDQNITAAVLRQYSKELECPLSFQPFDFPVSAYCGHTFSWLPLYIHLKNDSRCPLCRQHVEMDQLKPNFVVRNLVQIQKRLQSQRRERELKRQEKKKLQQQAAKRERMQYLLAEQRKRMQHLLVEKRKRQQQQQRLRQQAAQRERREQKCKRVKLLAAKIAAVAVILILVAITGHHWLISLSKPRIVFVQSFERQSRPQKTLQLDRKSQSLPVFIIQKSMQQ